MAGTKDLKTLLENKIVPGTFFAGTTKDLNADQIKRMDEISCGRKDGSYRLAKAHKFVREGERLTIQRMRSKMDR